MSGNLAVIQLFFEGLAQMIRVILFFTLWNRFVLLSCPKSRRTKREIVILVMVLIFIGQVFGCLYNETWPLRGIVHFTVIMVYTLWRRREDIRETIFSCFLYLNFRYLSYFAVNSFAELITDQVMDKALEADDIESYVLQWVDILSLIIDLSYVVMIAIMIIPVVILVRKRIKMSWSELAYLSVMNIAGVAITRIMLRISVIKTDDGLFVLVNEKPALLWQLPMVAFLLYLGELSALYIWQRYDDYREQGRLYFAENMEKEAIKKRLKETEDYYGRIRCARHEMANHFMTIKGLADGDHNKELSDYISRISETIEPINLPFSTGNPVTDVVLGDKYRCAADADVQCDFTFSFDIDWGIPVYDISIILSNVLDNAIEAASAVSVPIEKRYIFLRLIEKEKIILIRCENSFDPESQDRVKQKDKMWHGIGLKNIKDIASRYEGGVDTSNDGNTFVISVMMKKVHSLQQADHS